MPQSFRVEYNDFGGGLNKRYAPHLIQPNEAQVARNVDIQDRVLKGMKDWATEVVSFGSAYKWLWYSPNSTWVKGDYANETRFALNDGSKVYATREGKRPIVYTPSQTYDLGISPPNNVAYAGVFPGTASKSGVYKYAFTFVTADGLESNPQDFELTLSLASGGTPTAGDINFTTLPTTSNTRVVARRIYRSLANSDAMYFLYEVSDRSATTSWLDDKPDGALDLTRPLTWNDGGFPSSGGVYIEDHSIPPSFTVLSTGMHSASGGTSGRSGSGIVFAANGADVYWSMLGFPDYWPSVNQFAMPENVESITALGGSTFVFTPNFIYQARGDSDDTISWSRSNTPYGVRRGYGRFTTPTTKGILFFCTDGLALFDGSDARLVAEQKLPRTYFNDRNVRAVGFFNNRFYVFTDDASDPVVIFDFRDYPSAPVVVTTATHAVSAAAVANYAEPVTADVEQPLPGSISSISIGVPGSYYVRKEDSSATYTISATIAAPPSGTTATASPLFSYDSIAVVVGGSGFTSAPTITFPTPASGRIAKAVASVSGGKLVSIVITDPGSGYTATEIQSALSYSIGSGAQVRIYAKISSMQVTNAGTGYTTTPAVTISSTGGSAAIFVPAQLYAAVSAPGFLDPAAAYVGGALFRFGGKYLTSPNPTETYTNTVDKYDLSTKQWTRLAATLYGSVVGVATFSNGTNGYLAGGVDSSGTYSKKATVWTGTAFSGLADMPDVRAYGTLVRNSSGGKLYYFGGVTTTGTPVTTVYVYDPAMPAWSPLGVPLPKQLVGATAVSDGTKVYLFGGMTGNPLSSLNTDVIIFDLASEQFDTSDTTGPTYGWLGRQFAQSAYYGSKCYIYGGTSEVAALPGTLGNVLSDLWIYDPAASPKWQCRTGEVVNAYARARAGYAYDTINGLMYTIGGMTTYQYFAPDILSIPLAQASDCSSTPGLYVVESSTGKVRLYEGSTTRMDSWIWQGRYEVGTIPGPRLTWTRVRASVVDGVAFGAYRWDANGPETNWNTYATTPSTTTLGTPVRFWLPSTASGSVYIPRGQRLSLRLAAASGRTDAEVHRVEIDAKMDTDGQG